MNGYRQRILRATTANLSWQPQGPDGEPFDVGTVTVAVTTSDGTVVVAAGTATSGTATAVRTVPLTPTQTAKLDELTAVWTASGVTLASTVHEIVGGFYFTSADLRGKEPSTADQLKDPTAKLLEVRTEVETVFESVCQMAFVPRFGRFITPAVAGCSMAIPYPYLRVVRWMRFTDREGTITNIDPTVVAGYPANLFGRIDLRYGYDYGYRYGYRVEVGFEHGLDAPPADVQRAALTYARSMNNRGRTGIPDRATSMTSPEGASFTLATPGVRNWHTGIPDVDEVLMRYPDLPGPMVA